MKTFFTLAFASLLAIPLLGCSDEDLGNASPEQPPITDPGPIEPPAEGEATEPTSEDGALKSENFRLRQEIESHVDSKLDPFMIQPGDESRRLQEATKLVAQNEDGEPTFSDLLTQESAKGKVENIIEFTSPAEEPNTAPKSNAANDAGTEPSGLGAAHNQQDAIRRGTLAEINSKLDGVLELLESVADKQIDEDLMRTIVREETQAVMVSYKTPNGEEGSAKVEIDDKGQGIVALPPGAVVTEMGGVPVDQYFRENPTATVDDNSCGPSVLATDGGIVVTNDCTPTAPLPIAAAPVVADTQYYVAPDQYTAQVSSYPDSTVLQMQVDPQYVQAPPTYDVPATGYGDASQCYTDPATGQTTCPPSTSTPSRSGGGGLLRGLFRRR